MLGLYGKKSIGKFLIDVIDANETFLIISAYHASLILLTCLSLCLFREIFIFFIVAKSWQYVYIYYFY